MHETAGERAREEGLRWSRRYTSGFSLDKNQCYKSNAAGAVHFTRGVGFRWASNGDDNKNRADSNKAGISTAASAG